MKPKELLEILSVAEKLKCNTRHCYTSSGRRESVAEHSWRISLMAMLLTKEFPEADMDKVIRMVPDPRHGRSLHRGHPDL